MLRSIAGAFAGIVVAVILVSLVELLGHQVYPPPADIRTYDAEKMAAYVEALPLGAFLFVLAAWVIGAFGGSGVALMLAPSRRGTLAWVVTGFILVSAVMNLLFIPHPVWFGVATAFLLPAVGFAASRCFARSPARPKADIASGNPGQSSGSDHAGGV